MARSLIHYGEEPPISGERGSGTLFFSHCPLDCLYCQNYQISQLNMGRPAGPAELADMMLELEAQGAHNINLVSPTPWVERIVKALESGRRRGLSLPVVYNTGGFDSPVALEMMDGLVDVYLPDAKYASPDISGQLSSAPNYVAVNRAALKEMFRQVGHLTFNDDGIARKGMLVRHLVLPGGLSQTGEVLRRLAAEFGVELWMSLMAQYKPCHGTALPLDSFPPLSRTLTEDEYEGALDLAWELGLENVFIQELSASDTYVPDFERETVFEKSDK